MINEQQKVLSQNIGIAGCGNMGLPMIEVLLNQNLHVQGYDVRDKDNFPSIQKAFVVSKAQFISNNDIILSVVRDEEDTIEFCDGPSGLFSARTKKLLLVCSTLSPRFVRKLQTKAPKNIEIIDSPMSGASIAAKEARLTFMVGSKEKQFSYIYPLLALMGKNVYHLGDFGSGMATKVLNNFVTASTVVSTRHVIYQAKKMNVNIEKLMKTIDCSSGQNWFATNRSQIDWFYENYAKSNTIGILEKDVKAYADVFGNSPDEMEQVLKNFCQSILTGLKKIPD